MQKVQSNSAVKLPSNNIASKESISKQALVSLNALIDLFLPVTLVWDL